MRSRLGIVTDEVATTTVQPQTVSMRLGDLLRPLADAFYTNRTFLTDFADDEVQLPADLLEVLTAYEQTKRAA
jgi:hypothetical protein